LANLSCGTTKIQGIIDYQSGYSSNVEIARFCARAARETGNQWQEDAHILVLIQSI
jgi:hypothetical protein